MKELTVLVNLILSGEVNDVIIDVLYVAKCALRKSPIAVDTTYSRRKVVSEKFQPLLLLLES